MKDRARNAIELTSRLIEQFGPRPPGSEASRGCADALAEEIRPFADTVNTEDFKLSPRAFLAWIRLLVGAYFVAVVGLWFGLYFVSSIVLITAIVILVLQFFLYKEVLDPFYPRSIGRNVIATLEPEGEVRAELFISGHHDSARVFNFLVHQPELYALRVNGGIGSLFLLALTSMVMTVLDYLGGALAWAWIPAALFSVLSLLAVQLWFFASSDSTSGAGDNLASSVVAQEFLKYCSEEKSSGRGFRHLRVSAVSWDAEEAGLRGSRAWRKDRDKDPILHPAWNLNLECLYSEKDFFLLTSDINGSVDLSADLAQRCSRILTDKAAREVPCRQIAFLTGGTDAGEVARAGVEATTLMGMPWATDSRSAVYHTPRDTVDSVSTRALEEVLILADTLAEELDSEIS